MRRSLLGAALFSTVLTMTAPDAAAAQAAGARAMTYPQTRRADLVEPLFGAQVADPYRWLENDVRNDAEVRAWVDAQNKVTSAFLATLPGRETLEKRITQLYDYERFAAPEKKGGRYFYTHNSGLQNQSVLFVRESVGGAGRVLIDPNPWSKDGATALAEWTPSDDGKLLAYAIQDGGTDWRTVKVMNVATGKIMSDELKWLKYGGNVSWAKDGRGFYYSRYPAPAAKATFQNATLDHRVYFHKLGTAQAADRLVYATPANPKLSHYAQVSDDGRWLVISTSLAGDENDVHVIDLRKPGSKPVALFTGLKNQWNFIGNEASRLLFSTDKDAPLKRVAAVQIGRANGTPVTVIPESKDALDGVSLIGGKLIASYLVDAKSEVRVYGLDGRQLSTIGLPGIGTVGGFNGKDSDPETFFSFTSFNRPTTVYRYDASTGQASEWAAPKLTFDPDTITVDQRFYTSKDGTRVPMFIVHSKDVTGPAPTVLYGYGGGQHPPSPAFRPGRVGRP